DRMVKDAEVHAEEDKKRREEQETRNNAESMVYQTRKFMEENSDKVSEDIKGKVEEAAKEVEESLKGEDLEAIKTAVEKLSTESQEMGKAIYEADANAGATQAQAGDGATAADDNVVDAEVVEDEAGTDTEGEKK